MTFAWKCSVKEKSMRGVLLGNEAKMATTALEYHRKGISRINKRKKKLIRNKLTYKEKTFSLPRSELRSKEQTILTDHTKLE